MQPPIPDSRQSIAEAARQYALQQFNQHKDPRLVYHNFHQSAEVADLVQSIGEGNGYPDEVIHVAQAAAWLCNLGYLRSYDQAVSTLQQIATNFISLQQFSKATGQALLHCLEVIDPQQEPGKREAQLFRDAYQAQQYGETFEANGPLHQLEVELVQHQPLPLPEWTQLRLQQLLRVTYYTPFGKQTYEPLLAQHILEQKALVEKYQKQAEKSKKEPEYRKFQAIEKKVPTSAIQTFYRTNYRNHINLSAIADNKANIMISVNAILISVIISAISYKNITETTPMILMPAITFLITGLASLTCAVLSARPKVTNLNTPDTPPADRQRNVVFFGNFVGMKLEEYEEAIDAMFRSGELIYGNMTRDLYYLGKVLDKKYKYLTLSYNIFMVGFAATVITFLIALLT
jgi:hypothetical protein